MQNDQHLAIEELQKGIIQHRSGQLALAQSHYQRAAKLDPKNPNAWHLLGVCALQADNPLLAAKHLRASTELSPGFAEAHNNLGVALRRLGKHEESAAAFRNAMKVREHYVEAAYNLGLSLEAAGKPNEAESTYRQALAWRSHDFNSANNLGNLLRRQGRFGEALPLLESAQRLQPQSAQANGNYAMLLVDLGRAHEAARAAQAATAIEPKNPLWWATLGVAERVRHNVEAAMAALRKALELDPNDQGSRAELALALSEAGEIDAARATMEQCLSHPRYGERLRWAYELSLPSVYADEAQVDAERERFLHGLGKVLTNLKLDTPQDKLHAYEAATGVATFLLHYQGRNNTEQQNRFGDLVEHVLSVGVPKFMSSPDWTARAHGGRIRVGVVSSHLMQHTVSRYFRNLITGLDPGRFDVRVWYSGGVRDASTEGIAKKVAAFEYVTEDAIATAAKIRAAQLDALIYAETGMDPRHHVMGAMRLAPVQCVLYGHPATSGLANMDYFVSGEAMEPENAAAHYREKLTLLPGLGACPERPPAAGDGAWLDEFTDGRPIALCLQNHLKLVPAFDAVLARIAKQSDARIGFFVRNSSVGQRFRARLEAEFVRHGLDPARTLAFLPAKDHAGYLGGVARAALVLDSPWFSGGATSLDAFSVGTPVLTWRGNMARGRQTLAMLRLMDIDGLVAADEEDYVAKAAELLADAQARNSLRERIAQRASALFESNDEVIAAFEQFLDASTREAAHGLPAKA